MRSFLLMTVVSAAALSAQNSGTGSLTGKILDPDGVPARGLPVQAVNLATRAVYKASVSTQGEFSIAQLPAGTYQFSTLVLANRMLPYVQDDLKIAPGQTVKLEIRMQEGITLNTLGDGRDYFSDVAGATHVVAPKGETPRMPDGKPDFSGIGPERADRAILARPISRIGRKRSRKKDMRTISEICPVLYASPTVWCGPSSRAMRKDSWRLRDCW